MSSQNIYLDLKNKQIGGSRIVNTVKNILPKVLQNALPNTLSNTLLNTLPNTLPNTLQNTLPNTLQNTSQSSNNKLYIPNSQQLKFDFQQNNQILDYNHLVKIDNDTFYKFLNYILSMEPSMQQLQNLKMLLEHGPDVDITSYGYKLFMIIIDYPNEYTDFKFIESLLQLLVKRKLNPNILEHFNTGETVLINTIKNKKNIEIAKILFKLLGQQGLFKNIDKETCNKILLHIRNSTYLDMKEEFIKKKLDLVIYLLEYGPEFVINENYIYMFAELAIIVNKSAQLDVTKNYLQLDVTKNYSQLDVTKNYYYEFIGLLLKKGLDPNKNIDFVSEKTLFEFAVDKGDKNIIKIFIHYMHDITNKKLGYIYTKPSYKSSDKLELFEYLLYNKDEPIFNIQNFDQFYNFVMLAIIENNIKLITKLLEKRLLDPNRIINWKTNETILMFAIRNNKLEIVEILKNSINNNQNIKLSTLNNSSGSLVSENKSGKIKYLKYKEKYLQLKNQLN